MDRDCHYYLTYLAAREAEFAPDDAHEIASAAQYIDDCHESLVYYWNKAKKFVPFATHLKHRVVELQENGKTVHKFHPILTGMFDMAMWAGFSGAEGNRQVWVPFHFLPGNFELPTTSRPACDMHEVRTWQGKPYSEWPDVAKTYMPFLCRPNSPVATDAVRSMVRNYGRLVRNAKSVALHHLGVVMHVLADTFAHQDFAGTPLKELNDVSGDSGATEFTTKGTWVNDTWVIDDSTWKEIDWYCGARPSGLVLGTDPLCIYPPRGSDNSYLGHGMAGHLPDTSCIAFRLKRPWSTEKVVRNNPQTYLQCFMNMVTALRAAKNGAVYNPLNRRELTDFFHKNSAACQIVQQALIPDEPLQNELYKKKLRVTGYFPKMETRWHSKIATRHTDVRPISDYEALRDRWRVEFLAMAQAKTVEVRAVRSDGFFSFNCAAKLHYRFVHNALAGDYSGMSFLRAEKFEKFYDPHLAMLDDVITVFNGSGSPSREAWVMGAFPFFTRAMEAANKPQEIIGLEFMKDAVINAANLDAARQGLSEWIANEESGDEMAFSLWGNGIIKKHVLELMELLIKETETPTGPVTRPRSNAIIEKPSFLTGQVGRTQGRPRSYAIVGNPPKLPTTTTSTTPPLPFSHFSSRLGKVTESHD